MDADYEYCDGLFIMAVGTSIMEGPGFQLPDNSVETYMMVSDLRSIEIVLDMAGCSDSELL